MRRISILGTLILALSFQALAGSSLSCDGANQYVSVPGSTNLTPTPVTFEAWVYPTVATCNTILSMGDGGDNTHTAYIFQISGAGNCGPMNVSLMGGKTGAWDASASTIPLNAWTHVAVTYDGTNKQFFINGVLDSTAAQPGPLFQTNSAMLIGRQGTGCQCNNFNGQLAEVRIWNTIRTSNEIAADMTFSSGGQPGLVAYYHLNEGSGTTAYDASGNGHNGTVAVAAGWANSTPPFVNYALEFFGTNYLTVNPSPSLALSNQLTFEAWVWPQTTNCMTILSRGSGDFSSDYILTVGYDGSNSCGNGYLDFFGVTTNNDTGAWDESPTNEVPAQTWTHVAVTFDGSNKIFYINGSPVGTNARPGVINQTGTPLYIGRQGSTCDCNLFEGLMDEVRIWNVVRTPGEIKQDFDQTLTGMESGLVSYYRFDEGNGLLTADFSDHTNNATLSTSSGVWTNSGVTLIAVPTISDQNVSNITSTSAALVAEVAPNGADTTVWLEYGLTTNYGITTVPSGVTGTNTTPVPTAALLSGLLPGATYHAQWVASNAAGAVYGGDQTIEIPMFAPINVGFPAAEQGSVAAVGDLDNDGWLDILVLGWDAVSNVPVAQIWHNTGSGFASIDAGLTAVKWGSVALGDYDNDGRLDVLLTGTVSNNVDRTEIWRNTGSGFSNVTAVVASGMPAVDSGSAIWGDYDNDGKPDILLTGEHPDDSSGYNFTDVAQIWHNTGSGFVQADVSLPGVTSGSSGWIDFDGDGLLDIFLSGYDNDGNALTQLWRNTGHGFTNINVGVPALGFASFGWADFNNDGKLDFVVSGLSGTFASPNPVTQVWTNSGSGFAKMMDLPGLDGGSVSVADFDNDGLPDIVVTGDNDSNSATTKLFRNTGNGFVDVTAAFASGVPNVDWGFSAWADFDNDGRLDLLLGGNNTMQVWQNGGSTTNSPPTAPTGLTASVSGSSLVLNWQASSDVQTASNSLTYNLRIGTMPGGSDILAPNSAPDGWRRVPQMGPLNRQQFQLPIPQYPRPRYYISVQSIDGALAGSAFSPELALTIPPMFTSWELRSDGSFQAQFNATGGVTYDIQASSDLLHWEDILSVNLGIDSPFLFMDSSATNYPRRFYRFGAQ